jgi:hypothetical protein
MVIVDLAKIDFRNENTCESNYNLEEIRLLNQCVLNTQKFVVRLKYNRVCIEYEYLCYMYHKSKTKTKRECLKHFNKKIKM